MKRKHLFRIISIFFFLSIAFSLPHQSTSSVKINNISIQPGRLNTKVILHTDAPLSVLDSFYSEEHPSTIIINLEEVESVQEPQFQIDPSSLIEEIQIEKGEAGKYRILISLKEKVPYRIYLENNMAVVVLNILHKESELNILSSDVKKALQKNTMRTIYVENINVSDQKGKVDITASTTELAIFQVFALDNPLRLVVDLYDTLYFPVASDFPVNKYGVEKVRAAQFQTKKPHAITRIVCDLNEPKFYTFSTADKRLSLSFYEDAPSLTAFVPSPQAQETTEQKVEEEKQVQADAFAPKTIAAPEEKYTGEKLSIKFKDADLKDVVLYLGEFANLNVVFDPEVQGMVTCNLKDIPWDQALDIFLRNNKMGKTIEGNVLRVAPINILTREEDEQQRLRESKELAGPVQVKTFTLSYSKAKDIQILLQDQISRRGSIIVDERTNTVMISDVKTRMDLIEKLISVFDAATTQVSIEARIVEATTTFTRSLGIQWGWRGIADPLYGNQTSLTFPNKILADGTLIPQGTLTKGIGGPLGGYAINLPAPAFTTAIGLSLSSVLDTFSLDMALTALETSGEGQIISRPTVTTQNNKQAEIIQGKQIPVQTIANFSVTTRYVNAALELKVTPQITAEGTIIMIIEILNNSVDWANLVNGIPPITTQSAKTTVMIPDGGTTVIGGIYRLEDATTRDRVPLLHKIPLLGNLFRSSTRSKESRELLIFITPKIIKSLNYSN